MQDTPNSFDTPLAGLSKAEWLEKIGEIAEEQGYLQPLGKRHTAVFVEEKDTLLVTFETFQGIQALSDDAQPIGWDMVRALGWSHLCLISDGDTWFRDEQVYAFFDRLTDDGFFDEFEKIVFYGAGPCGYAAAAFSVAAPGATVVAVQPQATLDPEIANWDDRFIEMRLRDFTSRYGYAPDMMDAAHEGFVIFDPRVELDAMHAALFTRSNVTKLRMPFMGDALQSDLLDMQMLYRILARAGTGKLTRAGFSKMYRNRREHGPYLRKLMQFLDAQERFDLTRMLCRNVTTRLHAPRFKKRLDQLEAAL